MILYFSCIIGYILHMMNNLENKVETFIRKYKMLDKDDIVIAGVSGGADSVCLLFILCALRKKLGFNVRVCHVNHCIRGEQADADEAYVRELCDRLGVKGRFFRYDVEAIAREKKQSSEEAGRMVRREAFESMCGMEGGTKIATAHHRDDNAETVLLNVARGTGLKGLCGIQPVRGKWIRPLLVSDREEIQDYLKQKDIRWCLDATNTEDIYTRNRIRHNIIPVLKEQVNRGVSIHLNELAFQAQEVWAYLEQGVEQAKKKCVSEESAYPQEGIRIKIDEKRFREEMPAVQKQLLRWCLARVRGAEKDLEAVHVTALLELFNRQSGKMLDLPGQVRAWKGYSGIVLEKKYPPKEDKIDSAEGKSCAKGSTVRSETAETVRFLQVPGVTEIPEKNLRIYCRFIEKSGVEQARMIPQKSYTKWVDYGIIQNGLSVRTRQSGDFIVIDDKGSRQKLKSFFINEKIPREERDKIVLIADGNHILWIPGYRMSRAGRIRSDTKKILEIRITEEEKDGRNSQSTGL